MKKDTEQLENELAEAESVEDFLEENRKNFRDYTCAEYLSYLLVEKNLTKSEVIQKSELDQTYAYHIFAGRKNPSRLKIIALALSMKLSVEETQRLLYYAGAKRLYVRNEWDSIITFALQNGKSVLETNELLKNSGESPLLGDNK